MTPRKFALLVACALSACSGSNGSKDGGTAGGSNGGSNGGGPGGTILPLPDAGPLTATQICLALWAGQQRLQLLEQLPLVQQVLTQPQQGPNCPAPTSAQLAQVTQQTNALAAELFTLSPPDGGWPDGSGPNACDDPSAALEGLPAQIAASLTAGRVSWNAAANSACVAGLVLSNDLLAYAFSDGGSFPGEAQTLGSLDAGGGPCTQILQGQIADGGNCVYPFDCAAGLFCKSTGANGSCSGSCAPQIAPGAACAPLDECAGMLSCTQGFCGGPDAGPGPSHAGGVNASCTTSGDCQPCLVCSAVGNLGLCTTSGLAGESCTSDYSCGLPWLFCDPIQSVCTPAGTFGQTCTDTTDNNACLNGWCNGSTCQPFSAIGGPCTTTVESCLGNGVYCKQPAGGINGTCAPYPAEGVSCGSGPGLSAICANSTLYCDTLDAGTCLPLPGASAPCGNDSLCAAGNYCSYVADAGLPVCAPYAGLGAACTTAPCQAGLYCDVSVCAALLPGGSTCTSYMQCASGNCVTGICATPCINPTYEGCETQSLSFFLGLGGALVWFGRRRRRPSKS